MFKSLFDQSPPENKLVIPEEIRSPMIIGASITHKVKHNMQQSTMQIFLLIAGPTIYLNIVYGFIEN